MAISLKINGEYLQLPAGASMQLEQTNHLLQLDGSVEGEHSLPFNVELNDINVRLLDHPHLASTPKNTDGFPAQLFINGLPHSSGVLKIETKNGHYNFPQRGKISVYYAFNLGAFWQLIKDKTLRSINYGDPYIFPWNSFDVDGPNTGFIGHVTDVMNNTDPAAFDYAFLPVVNELGLSGQQSANCIINCCAPIGATVIPTRFSPDIYSGNTRIHYNQYSPFPYHRFVLSKLFTTYGWNIVGTPLADPDFLKSTLIHGAAIGYQLSAPSGSMNVEWDFKTMLPKVGLGNYLVSMANRFGWWYDFDDSNRTCTVRYRKDFLGDRIKKNFTGKSSAHYHSKISKGKIYSMQHVGATEKLDFTYLLYQGEVDNFYGLPTASASIQNHSYLVKAENAWYNCIVDTANVASWQKASDNLPNYVPDDATDSISTNMQLPGTVFIPYRNTSLSELAQKVVVPLVAVSDTTDNAETFYTAFHHGLQSTINNVSAGNYNYPFGSASHYAPDGTKVGNYALCWTFANGSADEGLYSLFWQLFLNFIRQLELVTSQLQWAIADVLNYRYYDTIVIRNTEYLVSQVRVQIPLPQLTEVEMLRVT